MIRMYTTTRWKQYIARFVNSLNQEGFPNDNSLLKLSGLLQLAIFFLKVDLMLRWSEIEYLSRKPASISITAV